MLSAIDHVRLTCALEVLILKGQLITVSFSSNLCFLICSNSLSPYCSDASVKHPSMCTFGSSSIKEQVVPTQQNGCDNAKTLPHMTLNIVTGKTVMDTEKGSENGELTPVVPHQNDFVDYDDNFDTASDGGDDDDNEDSIEVIEDDQDEVSINELNSNKAEIVKLPSKSFSGENLQDCANETGVVFNVLGIHDNLDAHNSDIDDILEKHFEENGKDKSSNSDVKCYEQKETEYLGVIKYDASEELSVIQGSTSLVDEDNLVNTGDIMLVTSTPAVGKQPARKRISRDLDDKGDTGTLKKFVDGGYVGLGRHRDGSELGEVKVCCFLKLHFPNLFQI